MKPAFVSVVALSLSIASTMVWAGETKANATTPTEKDTLSYSLGMDIGQGLKEHKERIDPKAFNQGFQDAFAGTKTVVSEAQKTETLQNFHKVLTTEREKQLHALAEINLKKGQTFLEANKKKPGVNTLPSGLQYKVVKEGEGNTPTLADVVSTHYRGTNLEGQEFDSSYKRGEPVIFPVQGLIPGWTEALQRMKVGAKWELYVPANLAYGPTGAGRAIGPNETLIFEVELLEIRNQTENDEG